MMISFKSKTLLYLNLKNNNICDVSIKSTLKFNYVSILYQISFQILLFKIIYASNFRLCLETTNLSSLKNFRKTIQLLLVLTKKT